MMIFFVGIVEMLIVTAWTQTVTKTRVLASGTITVINVLVWYYVLENIVNNLGNVWIVLLYAAGCAVGTMISTYYLGCKENPNQFSLLNKIKWARKTKAKAKDSLKTNLEAVYFNPLKFLLTLLKMPVKESKLINKD